MVRESSPSSRWQYAPEEVEHWEVGRGLAVGHRRTFEHQPSLGAVGVHKFVDQAGLPDPGLPHQRYYLSMPRLGLLQGLLQRLQFMVPSDKPAQPTHRSRLQALADGRDPDQFEHLHGLCQALDRDRSQSVHPHQAFHQPQRRGRQQDAAGGGELFHACGQVRRLADGRVVHMQIVANGAHHYLTSVEPDPDLHRQSLRAPHLLSIALHDLLHSERRIAGPHGMIFMRDRRPKQGHNAIAHDLVHGAFVAVHGGHHMLQHRVEELARLFRVAIGQQLHRAFEVGKQHRDLLAFAGQGTAGGQDLLGQVRGRVDVWGAHWLWGRCWGAASVPGPDQDLPCLIGRDVLRLDEFIPQRL